MIKWKRRYAGIYDGVIGDYKFLLMDSYTHKSLSDHRLVRRWHWEVSGSMGSVTRHEYFPTLAKAKVDADSWCRKLGIIQ